MRRTVAGSKIDDAAVIRAKFNEAVNEAHVAYCDCEEVGAYLALEIHRLDTTAAHDGEEAQELDERITEKRDMLLKTKENMRFILDRIQELSREREKCVMDVYTSARIGDLETRLSELSPRIAELSADMRQRSREARVNAEVSLEVAQATLKFK
jgi:uncharacterized coiled-coil protein SlyX